MTDQSTFLNSYLSQMIISDLSIYNITSESRVMSIVESQLTFTDSNITNIDSPNSGDFLSLSFQSNATINNVVFSNSTTQFIVALLSSVHITSLDITNVILDDFLISYIDSNNVVIQDTNINEIRSTKDSMISLSGSAIDSISNLTITDSNVTSLYFVRSNVTMMNEIIISNIHQSIHIEQSHIDMLQNSHLSSSGSTDIINGGAMFIENSNLTMNNITFESNTAQVGGAVSINCDNYES